jgi:type I restriction-modification system DNA methylase subunit
MMTDIKDFAATFNKIAISKSEDIVFTDLLDISICALSANQYEKEYLSIIKRYKKEEVELFCELFARMVLIMDNDGAGLTDCLGEFYEQHLSRGKHGQFFTPEHVCDMMAAIVNPEESNKNILDPACGSGRMLLSAAKINRNNYFFGADIDSTCCKMAAINLCLNGMMGEIAWMDSLGGKDYHWGGYSIDYIHAPMRIPVISKLAAGEGIIINSPPYNRTKEAKPQIKQTKVITVPQAKFDF